MGGVLRAVRPVAVPGHDRCPHSRIIKTERGPLARSWSTVKPCPTAHLEAWPALIGSAYLPSTSTPVGRTAAGLPVGVQVVAPYLPRSAGDRRIGSDRPTGRRLSGSPDRPLSSPEPRMGANLEARLPRSSPKQADGRDTGSPPSTVAPNEARSAPHRRTHPDCPTTADVGVRRPGATLPVGH